MGVASAVGWFTYARFSAGRAVGDSLTPNELFGGAPTEGEQIACTMDAKQCPDGSYVGRSGPRCEFAPCPEIINGQPVVPVPQPPMPLSQ